MALNVFPSYSKYADVSDHILILFLNVLNVLQQQFGIENTKRAVQVFLDVAIRCVCPFFYKYFDCDIFF